MTLNCVVDVTSIVYLPEETLPVLTSKNTLLPVDNPCTELQVTVTSEPDLVYVEDIPDLFLLFDRPFFHQQEMLTSVGKVLNLTLTNLHRVSVNVVEL